MARTFITIGIVFLVVGFIAAFGEKFGINKLPGDIVFKKGNTTISFPIVTCIVLSILLSIVMRFFR